MKRGCKSYFYVEFFIQWNSGEFQLVGAFGFDTKAERQEAIDTVEALLNGCAKRWTLGVSAGRAMPRVSGRFLRSRERRNVGLSPEEIFLRIRDAMIDLMFAKSELTPS